MLIVFPIGLWVFSLVCDIVYYAGAHDLFWKNAAFYSMAGGILGALLAAIPGFIDFLSLTDSRVRKIATTHMVLNLCITALFLFNLGIRYNEVPGRDTLGVVLSVIGIVILGASGWLGGTLVYEHHVGVRTPEDKRERFERRVA